MKDDAISRQAAIDKFKPWLEVRSYGWGELNMLRAVINELENMPSVQSEREQMYKKAFSVACELLIGANLFGVTEETMFKEIMEKDGIVSSLRYERYILDNLSRLMGEDDGTD